MIISIVYDGSSLARGSCSRVALGLDKDTANKVSRRRDVTGRERRLKAATMARAGDTGREKTNRRSSSNGRSPVVSIDKRLFSI